MLFHFMNFSLCMFGHKNIYKVTNLKVYSKGRYLVKKNPFSRTTTNGSLGTTKLFPVLIVTSQILNPAYWNSIGWLMGEQTLCGVFISLYFWWKPTVFVQILDV